MDTRYDGYSSSQQNGGYSSSQQDAGGYSSSMQTQQPVSYYASGPQHVSGYSSSMQTVQPVYPSQHVSTTVVYPSQTSSGFYSSRRQPVQVGYTSSIDDAGCCPCSIL